MSMFARVRYCQSYSQIPSKLGIINFNEGVRDWYIKRFNPLVSKYVYIDGCEGLEVQLPLISGEEGEKVEIVKEKTLKWLIESGVEIMQWEGVKSEAIISADGKKIMPYFIKPAFLKACALKEIPLERAEVVIIDGNYNYTNIIINELSNNVNYLTVLVEGENNYKEIAEEVFKNTGLEIIIASRSKDILKYADVIINSSDFDFESDYLYKRNSVYIDLNHNSKRLAELIRKRSDMLIVEDFKLRGIEGTIKSEELDMSMYIKDKYYRKLRYGDFKFDRLLGVKDYIKHREIEFVALCQRGRVLKG